MKLFRIVIGINIIWFGIKAVQQTFNGIEHGVFPLVEYIPLTLLLIFTMGAFLTDRYHYNYDKKLYQYLTTGIAFLFCAFVLFRHIEYTFIHYSKTVLQVSNLPGASNVLKFEFKKNNRFRLVETNLLGETVFYGSYEKQQDTLFIGDNNYNGPANNLPAKGVIIADTVYWNKFDTMLVERRRD
jgi:hypothetical protein